MAEIRPKLKKLLEQRNMTQKELSEETGISRTILSEFSNGTRSSINKKLTIQLMQYFGLTSLDDLFEYVPDDEK
jgi:putative transcriptional regulator